MTYQAGLIAWAVTGILTAAVDMVMTWRRLSGKLGEQVRLSYARTAGMSGLGTRSVLIIISVADFLAWPVGLAGCLRAWARDWRIYQAELAREGL